MTTSDETQRLTQTPETSGRRRVSVAAVLLALVASIAAGLLLRTLLSGPAAEEAHASPANGADANDHADEHEQDSGGAGHDHAAHDHASHSHGHGETHATETTQLNNASCPVLGGPVVANVGVEHNGWWIKFCCPGCDDTFLAEPDAYAADLEAQTGIDIRRTPDEAAEATQWSEGPNGTRDLGNARDPVSGERAHADVGVEINGWWVRLASPASIRAFVHDLDRFAPVLVEATGVDVRHRNATSADAAPHGERHEAHDSTDHGGHDHEAVRDTVDIGNAACPVMGGRATEQVTATYNGWRVRFCCPGCDGRFLADPEHYAENLKAQTGHDIRVVAE